MSRLSKYLGGTAAEIYQPGNLEQSFLPRSKYQFTVKVTHLNLDSRGEYITSTVFERISSIDMPGHNVRNSTINQYNKKRIVQTGIDYTPVTLVAYDTIDGGIENFLLGYHNYYFKGVMIPSGTKKYLDDINLESFVTDNNQTGYRAPADKNFIKNIQIIRRSSDSDINVITMYNPVISTVDADNLNYSDSQPVQYKIGFVYEGYDVHTYNSDTYGD